MGMFSKMFGTMAQWFHIGGPTSGVRLENSGQSLHVRNSADTAFRRVRQEMAEIAGSNSSGGVVLDAPAGMPGWVTFKLPAADGTAGQFIRTDGLGGLSFANAQSNADLTEVTAFTQASASPLTLFTPPAGAYIKDVIVRVSAAAAGGSPTLSVGISGTPAAYMDTIDNDLKSANEYSVPQWTAVGGSPAAIIATIVASAQTFSGEIAVVYGIPS